MQNLNLSFFKEYDIKDVQDLKRFKIDPTDDDKVYFCDSNSISLGSLNAQTVTKIIDFPCEIIGFEYISMNHELCIATEDGAVYTYNLSTKSNEEVTFCDDGILAMEFSWDQETLVFVTRKANVVVLNCAYDVVQESNLLDDAFGEKQFINVGWGNESTQFQGLAGKRAGTSKDQELLSSDATKDEDSSVHITWREDCEYFAVSFLHPSQGRMFKVFNKEGVLQFTSEKCSALQGSIAWRPSGNWIAVPEVYRNKYTISLFEKNGLKHREIALPFKYEEECVVNHTWSNDSEILLIHTKRVECGTDALYLYTVGNYHWYLKQTLRFDPKVTHVTWSPRTNEKKTLYVLLDDGHVIKYQWNYVINHSQGQSDVDQGVIGVIDGKKLLLTGLRGTVVPPPMSNFQLEHEREINFIQFINKSETNSNKFIIVDVENEISAYECVFSQGPVSVLTGVNKTGSYTFKIKEQTPLKLHNWVYKNETEVIFTDNKLIFYGTKTGNEVDILSAYELKTGHLGALTLKGDKLCAHYSNGVVTSINNDQETQILKTGQFSSQMTVTEDNHVILLQPWQNLYLNEQTIASNVTSFTVVDDFLMYTTLDELKFINLRSSNRHVVSDRKLERGSKIVHVVAGTSKTVFQLPRGNLETIHPRILSLSMIRTLLDNKSYRKAFEIMRKERINLNLLVDHNPNEYLTNIDTFVDDINNIQWLDIFLTELQNIDVTREMYPYYHLTPLTWENVTPESKINFVCQKMIETLGKRDDSKYSLPLITCHVKKSEVGEALQLIWDLKLKEDQGTVTTGRTTSDDAFKYLLYLVNVNDLYNIALGLYDFALVLYVAKRSQKDPKEYVPFLEELDKLEENYRRYKIDCYIKRYEKALKNISQCGESRLKEALTLIEKHQLYTIALESYKSQPECYKKVCSQYGDFLRQKHKLLEASFMYERAGDYPSAISCARNALAWKRCIALAKRNGSTQDDLQKLFTSLIPALEGAGLYHDAASIAKDHLSKTQAIAILMKGKLYEDAVLLCHDEGLDTLVNEKVKPNLSDYLDTLMFTIEEELQTLVKQRDRLVTLRTQKAEVDEDGKYDDDVDLFSDTSSMNSSRYTASSGKTSKSSKNRRKHERKLFSLKEGSKFEDIALVDSLHKLVTKIYSTEQLKHVKCILTVATDLNLDEKARKLQIQYRALMHTIKTSLDKIWIPEMIVSEEISPNTATGMINFDQIQRNQHYSLIKPHQRYKPELVDMDFELEIYK